MGEDTGVDDDWTKEPFEFMQVESMLDEMLTEEEVATEVGQSAFDSDDGCFSFDESEEESMADESIGQTLTNEYRNTLTQESEAIEHVNGRKDSTFDLKICPHV